MNLTRDNAHIYRIDETVVPGVNEVLQAVGLVNTDFIPNGHAERGKAIHKACALIAEDRIDWDSVPEDYMEYINNYWEWMDKYNPIIISVEKMLYHSLLAYAGTLDLVVEIDGDTWVIDLKTGSKMKQYPLQLTAYGLLLQDHIDSKFPPRIGCLYIKNKTDHVEVEYDDTWMAALKVYRYGR